MDFTFKESEIEQFADKVKYIPEWFKQFFYRIHKKDKTSEYYKGCFATLRFILKFRKSSDKDKVIFYSLPCISQIIVEKIEGEKEHINDEVFEKLFKDLILNINYVYKGDEKNMQDIDINEIFNKMEMDDFLKKNEEKKENLKEEENVTNEIKLETIPEKIKENKKIKENEIKLETIPENSQLINENVEKIEIQEEIILPLVKEDEEEEIEEIEEIETIETIEIINDNIK
jgi:hypothetical protein